jgi:hypothetical protein
MKIDIWNVVVYGDLEVQAYDQEVVPGNKLGKISTIG